MTDNQELLTDTTDCESVAKSDDFLDDMNDRMGPDSQEPDDSKDDFTKVYAYTIFLQGCHGHGKNHGILKFSGISGKL